MESEDASVSSISEKRRLSSIEEIFSVFCNPFGGYPKTSSGPLVTLRAVYLDARYVWPFRSPNHWPLSFIHIKLRLSHIRGQRLLNYSVRSNSLSDIAHLCRYRSGHVHYSRRSSVSTKTSRSVISAVLARRSYFELVSSPNLHFSVGRCFYIGPPLIG